MPADGFNLLTEWTTIPHLFISRERKRQGTLTTKQTMDRSRTIPLCGLSVGEPGDPGCGDVGWYTEGETEKVTVLTLFTIVRFLDEPGNFAHWQPQMEARGNCLTTTKH